MKEDEVFGDIDSVKSDPDPEVAELGAMLIEKKKTHFDPAHFEDRYENALIELIQAKKKVKKPPKAAPRPKENVVNLMALLKKSLAQEAPTGKT